MWRRLALGATVALLLGLLGMTLTKTPHTEATGAWHTVYLPMTVRSDPSLPPAQSWMPSHFGFGLANFDTAELPPGVPHDYRYTYLCGGVNTGSSWATWFPNGTFVSKFITDSRAKGMVPVLIYYQITGSAPNYTEYSNLQNASTMRSYYDDFKLMLVRAKEAGGTVLVNIEPDLTGFLQAHATNVADDPSLQPTSVASSGHPDVRGYANTFAGFYAALAHLRDLYAPNVILGIDVSSWGGDADIALVKDPSFDWRRHAARKAKYLSGLAAGYGLLFYSPLDRDSAYYQVVRGQDTWWDDTNRSLPNFNRTAEWMGAVMSQMRLRTMMWQVPVGNRVYRTLNNSEGHYQDNRAEYFLNPSTGRTHIQQWLNYGFIGMMFGAGIESQTHFYDARRDGITNPAPFNGNDATATYADDDGGYLRLRIGDYYRTGALRLP